MSSSAIELLTNLADNFPEYVRYQNDLARAYNHLGRLLFRENELSEAETAFRAAVALQERLTDDAPEVPQFKSDLAMTLSNLGLAL